MEPLTANVRLVSEQISEKSHRFPHSVALHYGNQCLSYEELEYAANHFAAYLMQLGVTAGDTVVICMERSFDWIVAALGTMRVGAAYVPLDTAWPDSRLRFAIKDSGAAALVGRATLLDHLQTNLRGIDPQRDSAVISSTPSVPHIPVRADSLAYVIYTSGSTGVPKGVEITHANLAHFARWHCKAFNVSRCDRASHVAGLGFDAAVWEIWPNLAAGATVCLADDSVRSSPDLMQKWMISERVTIGFVPTVHASALMALEWPAATTLRLLLTGGDVLHSSPALQLPFDVVNNYGPTECTVVATSCVLKSSSGGVPIGRPIAGTTVHLLNERGEPVSDGSTGEIYIGGDGVGRGYRNLPELSNRSFLPDPFSLVPNARLYRTGDRGVRRTDGEIEFRGRVDRQIKIRGQRVELDEISSILTRHPSVDFATAITRMSQKGEVQLVAYILPKDDARVPAVHELRELLLNNLPDYMIPVIFARLYSLPLSANGKIDLTTLSQLADVELLEREKAPVTPIVEKLLIMVRKLLENETVEAKESFFLAGGHSLLGMQLLVRVREEFGLDLTVRQLFENPTVECLASLIETILADVPNSRLSETLATLAKPVPIPEMFQRHQEEITHRTARNKAELPAGVLALQSSGTRSSIFWLEHMCVDLARGIGDERPLFLVTLTAQDFALAGEPPTIQGMASRALRKIMMVQPNGPYIVGGYCRGGIIAYEIASQLQAAGHEVTLLTLLDAPNPSYIESCDSLKRKANYLSYVLARAARIGIRKSCRYFCDHLPNRFTSRLTTKSANKEISGFHEMMQAATLAYHPGVYRGRVLLLLASEHPPHKNFVPGWQAVVRHGLHIHYLDGHHRDVLTGSNAQNAADAILSHLSLAEDSTAGSSS